MPGRPEGRRCRSTPPQLPKLDRLITLSTHHEEDVDLRQRTNAAAGRLKGQGCGLSPTPSQHKIKREEPTKKKMSVSDGAYTRWQEDMKAEVVALMPAFLNTIRPGGASPSVLRRMSSTHLNVKSAGRRRNILR